MGPLLFVGAGIGPWPEVGAGDDGGVVGQDIGGQSSGPGWHAIHL